MKANRNALHHLVGGRDQGIVNLGPILGIAGAIIGAVVVYSLLGALTATFFGGVADVTSNLTDPNVTTGDSTADTLLSPFSLLIAVGALFAFVTLALGIAVSRLR